MTKTSQGRTYLQSAIDLDVWVEEDGQSWDVSEIRDMKSQVKWAVKEMASCVRGGLEDFDRAERYMVALEMRNSKEEELEILEFLAS